MSGVALPLIHVIDDEASLRTALSRLLTVCGYRVALYESAEQFLARGHLDAPGCILLDINMPGMSGIQLQDHLTQAHSSLPVIFLTGNGDMDLRERALQGGAHGFLAKPVAKQHLLDAIERALLR